MASPTRRPEPGSLVLAWPRRDRLGCDRRWRRCSRVRRGAIAQTLPTGPVRAMDGQVLVSGEVVATIGAADDIAFFNYTDYEHNALRLFRFSLSGAWQPARRLAFVGEVRSEDFERRSAYAAYVRIRPWVERRVRHPGRPDSADLRRVQPARLHDRQPAHRLSARLPVPDVAPPRRGARRPPTICCACGRAAGSRASRSAITTPSPGVPLVTRSAGTPASRRTGTTGILDAAGAVTAGTLSDPHADDNNRSPQVSGRVAVEPAIGLVLGASAARGAWLSKDVARIAARRSRRPPTTRRQALGADAEYSRDHWLVRSRAGLEPLARCRSRRPRRRRRRPRRSGGLGRGTLQADAAALRRPARRSPRLLGRARRRRATLPWDAPVNRVEAARRLLHPAQPDGAGRRPAERPRRRPRPRRAPTWPAQLAYWF